MKNFLIIPFLAMLFACGETIKTVEVPVPQHVVTAPQHHATGYIKDAKSKYGRVYWRPKALYKALRDNAVPDKWDWREHGGSIPILDQGQCGSCWAFGTVAAAMSSAKIFLHQDLLLSPQEIVAYDTNSMGCGGGNFAGDFVKQYGLVLEKDCPYTASNRKCKPDPRKAKPAYKPKDFVYIGDMNSSPTFDEVRAFIYQYGYVGVSAGADNDWESYHGGVFNRCNGTGVNHEIAAVAYDVNGKTITIQNSWGSSFGDHGYMTMPWGCDNLAADAGAFIVDSTPCKPPKVHLAAEYIVNPGSDVVLAVIPEQGVTYKWSLGLELGDLGTGPELDYTPTEDSVIALQATNACGVAQVQTLVTIKK